MTIEMEEEIKRWTARRKSALALDIIQGKTTVSESPRQFDLPPSEIEAWLDQAESGMENTLKAKPEDIREQYESHRKALQEAHGEAMLELLAPKNGTPCWARRTRQDPSDSARLQGLTRG
jgi:transposase-like protein